MAPTAAERFAVDRVPTPALVVDIGTLDANIAAMAAHCRAEGIRLRPHAKTHKSPAVGGRQLAAGAVGLSVATLGEAEVFAAAGVTDLFVAYPLWPDGTDGPARFAALRSAAVLTVGVDSVAGARRLASFASGAAVMVEVDCGLRRTGVEPAAAGEVAAAAAGAGLEVGGVFTFPGHSYGPGRPAAARADQAAALSVAAAALTAAGVACRVRSGGCTPTAGGTPGTDLDELRPGVYAFNDAQQVALGTCRPDGVALAAAATVVSAAADRIVLDAGSKVLGPDRPAWMPGHGLLPDLPGALVSGLWEHHAVVDVSEVAPADRPGVGDRLAVLPNHVCTAVNLARWLHVAEAGEPVDRWEVAAQGANR